MKSGSWMKFDVIESITKKIKSEVCFLAQRIVISQSDFGFKLLVWGDGMGGASD